MFNLKNKLHDKNIEQQEVFKEILDALTFIEAEFVPREEFDELEGNILVETENKNTKENQKSINRKDYILYLPENITNNDKIEIYNILEKKFSKELGFISGEKKIKAKIFYAVQDILNNKNESENKGKENSGNKNNEEYSKLEELYKKIFNQEKLPDILEIEKFFKTLNQKEKLNFKRDYIYLARKKQNGQNISEILDSEIDFHFEDLFFRQGVNNLRFDLKIMTQGEQALLIEKKGKEITEFHSKTKDLDEKEKLLRDKIKIEKFKVELEEIRKSGNKKEIADKELEATNVIIKELYNNFPYNFSINKYGDKPSKIQQSKELFCVGYSVVGHAFLDELGIKHKGLDIENHSALEINIGGKNYIFDATREGKVYKIKYLSNKGFYKKIMIKNEKNNFINNMLLTTKYYNLVKTGDVNKILLSQIYFNKGLINKSININKFSSQNYLILAKNKLAKKEMKLFFLYYYLGNILEGKHDILFDNIIFGREKKQIRNYIIKKDFKGLETYLLKLEKRI